MADAPRRRGPKPQGPFENKRFRLSLRITEDTRRMLEQAAADSGRSLMQEAELRLVESFTVGSIVAAAGRMAVQGEAAMENARLMAAEAKSAMERADLAFDRAEKLLSRIPEELLSHISELVPRRGDE